MIKLKRSRASYRKKLGLHADDPIRFEIEGDDIKFKKLNLVDIEFTSALIPTLSEWGSQNDEEAFGDL